MARGPWCSDYRERRWGSPCYDGIFLIGLDGGPFLAEGLMCRNPLHTGPNNLLNARHQLIPSWTAAAQNDVFRWKQLA